VRQVPHVAGQVLLAQALLLRRDIGALDPPEELGRVLDELTKRGSALLGSAVRTLDGRLCRRLGRVDRRG